MNKKNTENHKISRTSMEHRFDYLLRSVLSEIETRELKKTKEHPAPPTKEEARIDLVAANAEQND